MILTLLVLLGATCTINTVTALMGDPGLQAVWANPTSVSPSAQSTMPRYETYDLDVEYGYVLAGDDKINIFNYSLDVTQQGPPVLQMYDTIELNNLLLTEFKPTKSSIIINDIIYGLNNDGTVFSYDILSTQFTTLITIPGAANGCMSYSSDNSLFYIFGEPNAFFIYDYVANSYSVGPSLVQTHVDAACTINDNYFFVFGGAGASSPQSGVTIHASMVNIEANPLPPLVQYGVYSFEVLLSNAVSDPTNINCVSIEDDIMIVMNWNDGSGTAGSVEFEYFGVASVDPTLSSSVTVSTMTAFTPLTSSLDGIGVVYAKYDTPDPKDVFYFGDYLYT